MLRSIAAETAAPAATGAGAHSKAPPRRKKGSIWAGQQIKAGFSSTSDIVSAEDGDVEAEHAPAAGHQRHEHLPPRSPPKVPTAANVCVPTLEDALDDVQVRFVLNLPEAELSSADRLFFQLEQAWWFYEDFIADAHKHLPHFKLKEFAKLMFEHCEALRPLSGKYNELFEYFKSWKGTIPTAGCILLNAAMTDLVLVKCWKGNSRGLPKGKINQGEPAIDAALREVLEETGYDARGNANEKDFLTLYLNGQQTTMFIVVDVDETFRFEPQVRKEISAIEWFPLDALPKGSYGVEPFIPRLRRWMAKTKGVRAPKNAVTPAARTQSLLRVRKARATSPDVSSAAGASSQPSSPAVTACASNVAASSKKQRRKGSKGATAAAGGKHNDSSPVGGDNGRSCSAPSRRGGGGHPAKAKGFDTRNRDTFGDGGGDANGGGSAGGDGWDFEAMLAANERLTGRTFIYDGNPHEFGDPAHAARVPAPTKASPGAAAATATASTAAAATPTRSEDQVVHLKQRDAGECSKRKSAQGRSERKGAGAAPSAAPATGAFPVIETGMSRSRSRGKGRADTKETTSTGDSLKETTNVATPATRAACSQAVGSLCAESAGGRGPGRGSVSSMWADAPSAATSSTGASGGNVFGDFKFDMLDIMSAVSQG